ncbi:DUF1877 family protein [Streptomyces sp. NPDC026666]
MYFHLRAVPPPALRNSANWMRRLFEDDSEAVRLRVRGHREGVLDRRYLDHDLLYAGVPPHGAVDGPRTDVVLGGRPVFPADPDRPPFLTLTAEEVDRVAGYLASADFEVLWALARETLLPGRDEDGAESGTRAAFESAHRDLTAFYGQSARHGDAVVKWLVL